MKSLNDYIKNLPHYTNINEDHKSTHNKEYYIGDKKLKLSEFVYESSFEQFIKDNNITEITDDTYRFYLDNNFNDPQHIDTFNGRWYSTYQQYLYENLLRSYDKDKLINKIKNICDINKITYISPKREITQFTIYLNKEDYFDEHIRYKLISLLRLYNYYWKTSNDDEYYIILEPYKPKEVEDYIYNECKGIIYTVTSAAIYNKIVNSKEIIKHILKPNKINTDEQFRDGRIFFLANNDNNIIKDQIRQIVNTAQIRYPVLLKVNLNKYRHKLKFRIDSSAQGYSAYFTEEPIPSYCITPLNYKTLNEYTDDELNVLINKDKELKQYEKLK